ncbi:MAG: glycosyltransferase, partial [Acidimicrobiales bacterium]|nr:glycosyltransferase [Acidimicrobiales bacterium]
FGAWQVIINEAGQTPVSLNRGLAAVVGDVLVRVDARSIIPTSYVRTVLAVLDERPEIAVVGGAQRAVPRDGSHRALGIARALNNRWSTGLARYRRTSESGPSDTVYLGAFRTGELRDAGGWDERFSTNQDFELNRRMSERGLVWFVGDLAVGYRPRSTLRELWMQYVRFGRWKAMYWSITGDRPRPRQLAILSAPVVGAGTVIALTTWRRRPAVVVGLVAAGAALGVEVERRGASEPPATAMGHAAGVAAIAVMSVGWLAGAYQGMLRWMRAGS